jgi:hypothetical protein
MTLEKRIERLEKCLVPDDDGRITAVVMIPYGFVVSEEEVERAIAGARAANPGRPCVIVDIRQPPGGGG